jgi:hypothetical protein
MHRRFVAICPAAIALAACRSDAPDVIEPPPGVPSTCTAIVALSGCNEGSLSFSCTSDRPDSGSAQLVCSAGSPGAGSAELYCCVPRSADVAGCTADAIPGCGATSVGFACTGSAGGPPTAPANAEGTIACSAGIAGSGSAVDFCCNTAEIPPECTIGGSATACGGIAAGYTCATGATPADGDPSLACAPGSVGSDATTTSFCCVPFATAADGCVVDDSVGCAAGEYAFRCSGATTPEGQDPALTCRVVANGRCCSLQ